VGETNFKLATERYMIPQSGKSEIRQVEKSDLLRIWEAYRLDNKSIIIEAISSNQEQV
jgi:hypothetical protein